MIIQSPSTVKVSCREIVGVDVGQGREQEDQRLMATHVTF